ncbi:hypothetical protein AWW68_19490 [Roseivirga spongicola]|uniref:Uncharacterized protein n=1 Tax=Roseivirga spongicola TaxID=333140 RepID=A0A150XCL2_9BACT|nr:hypothetical protein [Roseivirga spongicola]KYG76430.1 hypothetical protein AWW68_19490 [Roseivirga spongicola]
MSYQGTYSVAIELDSLMSDQMEVGNGLKLYKSVSRTGTKEKGFYSHFHNIKGKVVGTCTHSGNMIINHEKSCPITDAERYEKVTTTGNPVDVEAGDTVYFSFLAVENPVILEQSAKKVIISVKYHDLFCKVVDGEIKMLNHYLLYEPYHGEDIEEFEAGKITVKGKRIKYGTLELVLPSSGRKIGHGKVIAANKGIKGARLEDVAEGDTVLVHKKREQEVEIEGKKVFLTWNVNVFAKIEENEIKPVGKYFSIKPERPQIKSTLFIPETVIDKQKITDGEITGVGTACTYPLQKGDRVRFNDFIQFEGYNDILAFEGQILFKWESKRP